MAHILIVDSQAEFRQQLLRLLEDAGHRATAVATVTEAATMLQTEVPDLSFLDSYLPAPLEAGLYHADGQIDGEVYEYGSFLQSRMHAAGVTCSNCHDPHSAKLRAEGNALCAQCHLSEKFDVAEHYHHEPGSAGAQCVNCHMPTKNFMVVDARRDHSIRVPRPDLSVSLGTPNACSQCHAGSSAEWAAETVAGWYPKGRQTTPHYGTALHAGRVGAADAEQQLDRLILDQTKPAIVQASALPLLMPYASSASERAIKAAITDPDPLVRSAAPRALPGTPPPRFVDAAAPHMTESLGALPAAKRSDPDFFIGNRIRTCISEDVDEARRFESISLQRRVSCESFPRGADRKESTDQSRAPRFSQGTGWGLQTVLFRSQRSELLRRRSSRALPDAPAPPKLRDRVRGWDLEFESGLLQR